MIRTATREDIPRMVEMGRRFRNESSYNKYLADNPAKMAELGEKLVALDGIIVAERDGEIQAMLGYVVHEHFISGERVAGEIFWWAEPEHRGAGLMLLREMEKRARAAGAKYLHMIAPSERVKTLYERLHFDFIEATYQRAL